jgi:hypothetical protein
MSDITIVLNNTDDEETDSVLVCVYGDQGVAWATDQQSVCGSRWEVADGSMAYAIVDNTPNLPGVIADECGLDESQVDDSSWSPPDEAVFSPEKRKELIERAVDVLSRDRKDADDQ